MSRFGIVHRLVGLVALTASLTTMGCIASPSTEDESQASEGELAASSTRSASDTDVRLPTSKGLGNAAVVQQWSFSPNHSEQAGPDPQPWTSTPSNGPTPTSGQSK